MIRRPDGPVVFLSGAGLSAASGIPTFRGAGGLWEGYDVSEVATPEAWAADPALVRRFYDARRAAAESVSPNEGHKALARLQAAWGPDRVRLVTQNIDGLLQRAGAIDVVEMHGALRTIRTRDQQDEQRAENAAPQLEGRWNGEREACRRATQRERPDRHRRIPGGRQPPRRRCAGA